MMPPEADEPVTYTVLLAEPAEAEIETAYFARLRFGTKAAERWYAGLGKTLLSLETFPKGFPLAPENTAARHEIRQIVYGKGRVAYRILYQVFEPSGDDPGIVRVLHFRPASQNAGPQERE